MFKQILAISIALTLGACGQSSPGNDSNNSSVESHKITNAYAMRGADQSWPGTATDGVLLAENVSARNFYVVFDGSGSMNDTACGDGSTRVKAAKRSVSEFFNSLPDDTNAGLLVFDSKGLAESSQLKKVNKPELQRSIKNIHAGGGTPIGQALQMGLDKLTLQGIKQQGYGEYHLVVITDGASNDDNYMGAMVKNITETSPINIHTIGFCLDDSHALNKRGVVNYSSASNSEQLLKSLKAVLSESESFDATSFQGT